MSANHDTLASAKTIKEYIDTVQTLTGLTDTTIANTVPDNSHLQYDDNLNKWVNRAYIDFDKTFMGSRFCTFLFLYIYVGPVKIFCLFLFANF